MSQAEEPVATVHNSTSTSLYKKDSYKMLQSKSWIQSVAETLPRHAYLSDHTHHHAVIQRCSRRNRDSDRDDTSGPCMMLLRGPISHRVSLQKYLSKDGCYLGKVELSHCLVTGTSELGSG